jgi:hypothetical protein
VTGVTGAGVIPKGVEEVLAGVAGEAGMATTGAVGTFMPVNCRDFRASSTQRVMLSTKNITPR